MTEPCKHCNGELKEEDCLRKRLKAAEALSNVVTASRKIAIAKATAQAMREENTGLLKAVRAAEAKLKKHEAIYHAVNKMMAILGADGEVNTKQRCVTDVMDALADYDGGVYKEQDND